jgi:phosphoglycerate kinase
MTHELPLIQLPAGATRKRNVFDVIENLKKQGGDAKTILVRVDFNVPMKGDVITDDSRIRGALPTIKAILQQNFNVVLVSHMGRPKLVQKIARPADDDEETAAERKALSLKLVAEHLAKLLDKQVLFGEDCLNARDIVGQLPKSGGGLCLLENLRFYLNEEKNEKNFVETLASYASAYVNDAFGTSHRAHASVSGVPALFPSEFCGIGCLVASELSFLDFSSVGENDKIAAIIGGSKVSTKLPVIKGLLNSVDILVLGGGLAFTFLKAKGVNVGDSLLEEDLVETAKELMEEAAAKGKTLVIPVDAVCSSEFPKGPMEMSQTKTFDVSEGSSGIEDGWMGLDAGPKTLELVRAALTGTNKLVCNGPMGVFEVVPFDEGTRTLVQIMKDLTQSGTVTVVGGGDSVAALELFGETKSVSYVSTGGGATLELLAGDVLPGVSAIGDVVQ